GGVDDLAVALLLVLDDDPRGVEGGEKARGRRAAGERPEQLLAPFARGRGPLFCAERREELLDDHDVSPVSRELAMAVIDAHFAETKRPQEPTARRVIDEDLPRKLPRSGRSSALDELMQRDFARAVPALRARNVYREVENAPEALARAIRRSRRKRHDE